VHKEEEEGGARSTIVATSNGGKEWEPITDVVSQPATLLGTLRRFIWLRVPIDTRPI
jgi:hypothetical protein